MRSWRTRVGLCELSLSDLSMVNANVYSADKIRGYGTQVN